jgi:hypothetical protein
MNALRPKAPVLSDEAMSRESIYPDRSYPPPFFKFAAGKLSL